MNRSRPSDVIRVKQGRKAAERQPPEAVMSAPETNLDKQKKQHRGPLGGMAVVIAFVVFITAVFAIWLAVNGNEPRDAERIDDSAMTGEAAATE